MPLRVMFEGGSSAPPLSSVTTKTPAGTTLPKWYGKASGGTTTKKASAPAKKASSSKSSSSSRSSSSGSTSRRSSSTSSSGGGSGYSGGSSSRSTGSTRTGQVSTLAAAPVAPQVPTAADFLGKDSTYLAQLAAMNKALGDYRAQMGQSQNQYNTDYASRVNDLNINRTQDTTNQAEDFASRGMYISGLYGKDRSDLLGQFSRRQGDMDTARANYLSGIQNDYTNFQNDQGVSMTQAKQDALARRAAQYNLTSV